MQPIESATDRGYRPEEDATEPMSQNPFRRLEPMTDKPITLTARERSKFAAWLEQNARQLTREMPAVERQATPASFKALKAMEDDAADSVAMATRLRKTALC
jgi:hypothetical protein